MAFLEMRIYSKSLKQTTTVNILLPEAPHKRTTAVGSPCESWRTLWLLHGLSGSHEDWTRNTSIERYAAQYPDLCVVMPNVGRNWYTDAVSGANYFTYVTEELPAILRSYFTGMRPEREYNYVGGLSMGGYGAMLLSMTYPDRYAGAISLSGSIDITREGRFIDIPLWRSVFKFDLQEGSELKNTKHDIYHLIEENKKAGVNFPRLFIWCGTEDGLIHNNRRLHQQLVDLGIDHHYYESEGDHSWGWWDMHIQPALKFMFGTEE